MKCIRFNDQQMLYAEVWRYGRKTKQNTEKKPKINFAKGIKHEVNVILRLQLFTSKNAYYAISNKRVLVLYTKLLLMNLAW